MKGLLLLLLVVLNCISITFAQPSQKLRDKKFTKGRVLVDSVKGVRYAVDANYKYLTATDKSGKRLWRTDVYKDLCMFLGREINLKSNYWSGFYLILLKVYKTKDFEFIQCDVEIPWAHEDINIDTKKGKIIGMGSTENPTGYGAERYKPLKNISFPLNTNINGRDTVINMIFDPNVVSTSYSYAKNGEKIEQKHYVYFEPIVDSTTGITYLLDSNRIYITAIDKTGKELWKTDPWKDNKINIYRKLRPIIRLMEINNLMFKEKVLEIRYNTSQFGFLDLKTGAFTWAGQD